MSRACVLSLRAGLGRGVIKQVYFCRKGIFCLCTGKKKEEIHVFSLIFPPPRTRSLSFQQCRAVLKHSYWEPKMLESWCVRLVTNCLKLPWLHGRGDRFPGPRDNLLSGRGADWRWARSHSGTGAATERPGAVSYPLLLCSCIIPYLALELQKFLHQALVGHWMAENFFVVWDYSEVAYINDPRGVGWQRRYPGAVDSFLWAPWGCG